MTKQSLRPGLRAVSNKSIGRLPVQTIIKIIAADSKKISIEVVVDNVLRSFYLNREEFERDFKLMTPFFTDKEKQKEINPPHSRIYFYHAVK